MTGRGVFILLSAAALGVVVFTAVIRPAVERGGVGELIVIAVAFTAVLLVERWLRTR